MERLIVGFGIAALVFALTFMGSAMVGTAKRPAPVVVEQRPPTAKQLLERIEKLEVRLAEAQTSIDEVLKKLATANDDVTRTRLDVLYALERGLQADIAHTREALAGMR
jgi:hypothetical protein